MIIWHISDTHSLHENLEVPKGVDLVIHSGDATCYHERKPNKVEWEKFSKWFELLPIRNKVYVPGNHDAELQVRHYNNLDFEEYVLIEKSVEIEGIKIYGQPYTPEFLGWHFMEWAPEMYRKWEKVPVDTEILVSHGPPFGILDKNYYGKECGDASYRHFIERSKIKACLFGHIHPSVGKMRVGQTLFYNSSCTQAIDGEYVFSGNGHLIEWKD